MKLKLDEKKRQVYDEETKSESDRTNYPRASRIIISSQQEESPPALPILPSNKLDGRNVGYNVFSSVDKAFIA